MDTTKLLEPARGPVRPDTLTIFRRVLVPVDFNEATRCAVAEAIQLWRHFGSEVHLFRYVELDEASHFLAGTGADGMAASTLIESGEDRLRRFVTNVFPGFEGEVSVCANVGVDVADAVLSEAARVRATLVVIGVDARPHLLRTAVDRLLQRLTCPVLLVRSHAHRGNDHS